jgi:hypothetical protein
LKIYNFGVSWTCYTKRSYTTVSISLVEQAFDITTKIKAISDIPYSIEVSRSIHSLSSNFVVEYSWTITFHRQNGDLNPLACDNSRLAGTNSDNKTSCTVSTIRDSSLISGDFALGITYPHVYEAKPVSYNAKTLPWNIDEDKFSFCFV